MPPRRSAPPEDAPASELITELQDERTLHAAVSSREFFEKFQGEKEVRVPTYKQNPDSARWEYVKTLSPDIADEDYLRKTFGPGVYKFIARGPKSDQYPQGYYGTLTVAIADLETGKKDAVPVAEANTQSEKFMQMMLGMQMQHAQLLERLLIASLTNKHDGADPTKLLEIASGIAGKMHEGQQPFDPQQQLAQLLTFYDKGFERGQDIGAPRDEGYAGVIRDVAVPALQLLAHSSQPAQIAPVATPAALPPPQDIRQVKGPLWLNAVAPYFPILLNMATLDLSPENVAEMVLDKLPSDALDKIQGDCVAPNWENEVVEVLPDAFKLRYRDWTVKVLTAIKSALTEDSEPPIIGEVEADTGGE